MSFEKVLDIFKEEMYKHVDDSETRQNNTSKELRYFIEQKIESFQKSYEKFSMQMVDVQTANIAERVKLDKIDNLEKFKDTADESFFTLSNSIKKLQQDYTNSCNRYDKIFLENLEVPGIIGDFCKFKNLRVYIEHNRKEMENFDAIKEKLQMDMKSFKNILDTNVRQLSEHQETQEKRIKEFCYNILQTSEKNFKEDLQNINNNFSDIKMENGRYHLEAMKIVKELNLKIGEINEMKEEIYYALEKDKKHIETNNHLVESMKEEFHSIKNNHHFVNDSLKVIVLNINL